MSSTMLGGITSATDVTNISGHGLWVLVDDEELFIPFAEIPWFREAPVGKLLHVERPQPHHLYWPERTSTCMSIRSARPSGFRSCPGPGAEFLPVDRGTRVTAA